MNTFICSLPLISSLFSACLPDPPLATGYVEGELVLVAPVATAQIEKLQLRRGDRVREGDILVQLEARDAQIALADTKAALKAAEARLANLNEGHRDEEIAVLEASLTSARAQADEIARETERVSSLVRRGVAPQAQLDEVQSRLDVANARIAEVDASLAVARLPARPYEIAAAEAELDRAKVGVEAAQWQLTRRTLTAPSDGRVHEILRNTGEIAGPQAPVLSMLPDGAVLIRLYIPQNSFSGISVGSELTINCDGCGRDARAVVSYVSDEPEYTPPVIYSLENRQKLAYLIEARPLEGAVALKPGQIVDAVLTGAE